MSLEALAWGCYALLMEQKGNYPYGISAEYYFIPLMLLFCFAELFHNVVAGMADKLEFSFALTSKMDRASATFSERKQLL